MPIPQNHNDAWSWIRVYYFEDCKDRLILDGVWPAVTSPCLCARTGREYFYRDWRGGPNVLIGLQCCCRSRVERVASAIEDYVAHHPSTNSITLAKQARISESLKRYELNEDGGILRENNSIFVDPHDPEGPFVRDPLIKKAYREYLSRSSQFCVRWLQSIREEGGDRTEIALHLLVALVWLTDPIRLRSHVSLMSHAIGLFNGIPEGGRFYRSFQAHYASRSGSAIRKLTADDVANLVKGVDTLPGLNDFMSMLRVHLDDFFESTLSGRYRPEPISQLIDSSPAWRSWQMTISLLYRTLNQLGITPLQRFLASYMLSSACKDLYGDDAADLRDLIHRSRSDAESILTYFAPHLQGLEARGC